ncbi:hypothetical protein [Myceligenerans crystallogenes]|uniref:Uncharacterized protein n=1 Tax=Myceligenerans crystallogenes TaxID=316335 RepID=A0ABN2NJM1_9MICO
MSGTGLLQVYLVCPYCAAPDRREVAPRADRPDDAVADIRCMPYVRDVDRFDPATDKENKDPAAWHRVGQDFYRQLHWDQLIGILRIQRNGSTTAPDIRYRVIRCAACHELYDAYVLLGDGHADLSAVWPHLFGPGREDITPYGGLPPVLAAMRRLPGGALGLGLILLVIGWRWLPFTQDGGLTPWSLTWAAMNTLAAVSVAWLYLLQDLAIKRQGRVDSYAEVFRLRGRHLGIHWRNFTLARFVGVQPEPGEITVVKRVGLRLTQADMVGGILTWLMFAVSWCIAGGGPLALLLALAEAAVYVVGARWILGGGSSRTGSPGGPLARRRLAGWGLIVLPSVVVPAVVGLAPGTWLAGMAQAESTVLLWSALAYAVGVACYLALMTAGTILRGARHVPLRTSLAPTLAELGPLLWLHRFSWTTMVAVLVTAIVMVTGCEILGAVGSSAAWGMPDGADWLRWWALVAVTFSFVILATAGRAVYRWAFVGIALVQVTLFLLGIEVLRVGEFEIHLNAVVFTVGVVFLYVMHTAALEQELRAVTGRALERALDLVDKGLAVAVRNRNTDDVVRIAPARAALMTVDLPRSSSWVGTLLMTGLTVLTVVLDTAGIVENLQGFLR